MSCGARITELLRGSNHGAVSPCLQEEVLGKEFAAGESSGFPPCEPPNRVSSLLPPLQRHMLEQGGCQITTALSPQHGQPGLGSCPFFCSPHLLQKGLSLSQERPEICNRDVGLNIHQTHFPDSKRDRSQSWHRNTVSGHQCGPTSRCTRKTPGVERCGGGPALSPGVVASEEGQRVAAESRAVAFPLLSNPPFLHRRAC